MLRRAAMTNREWEDLLRRVSILEENVFKKVKRLRATEAQRFLIALHMGHIDRIKEQSRPGSFTILLLILTLRLHRRAPDKPSIKNQFLNQS
jgi:hypothetical protein